MEFLSRLSASWQMTAVLVASAVALGTAPLVSGVVVLAMLHGLQYAVALACCSTHWATLFADPRGGRPDRVARRRAVDAGLRRPRRCALVS